MASIESITNSLETLGLDDALIHEIDVSSLLNLLKKTPKGESLILTTETPVKLKKKIIINKQKIENPWLDDEVWKRSVIVTLSKPSYSEEVKKLAESDPKSITLPTSTRTTKTTTATTKTAKTTMSKTTSKKQSSEASSNLQAFTVVPSTTVNDATKTTVSSETPALQAQRWGQLLHGTPFLVHMPKNSTELRLYLGVIVLSSRHSEYFLRGTGEIIPSASLRDFQMASSYAPKTDKKESPRQLIWRTYNICNIVYIEVQGKKYRIPKNFKLPQNIHDN